MNARGSHLKRPCKRLRKWSTARGGKAVHGQSPELKGQQVMSAFERLLEDNPAIVEKPCGDAMATSLSGAFPAAPNDRVG